MAGCNCSNEDSIPPFRFLVDIILLKFVSLLYICTRWTQEFAYLLINWLCHIVRWAVTGSAYWLILSAENWLFCCLPIRKQKQKKDELLFVDLKLVRWCRQHKELKMAQFSSAFWSPSHHFYNPCTSASSFCFPFLYYNHIQSYLLQEMRMDQ